jgi:hypothetical protein
MLLALGLALAALAMRLRERGVRAALVGAAILAGSAGTLHLMAQGGAWQFPGHGPRAWHTPG